MPDEDEFRRLVERWRSGLGEPGALKTQIRLIARTLRLVEPAKVEAAIISALEAGGDGTDTERLKAKLDELRPKL